MHIDKEKLIELLSEASGLDAETTEKQLNELISEVKQSLSEDEAYEIENFGIFSSLGNRVMFIPSKELETEINFKYVGMEPIEMDEPTPTFDDPFDGLDDDATPEANEIDVEVNKPVGKDLGTRFAGLIDDDIKDPDLEPAEGPGPEMWGVEAHKEDESADRLFASLMGQDYEEPEEEEEEGTINTSEEDNFDGFDNIFADEDATGSDNLDSEVAAFMGGDDASTSQEDEKSTDDLLDDVFAEMESSKIGSENDDADDFFNLDDDSDVVIDYAEVPKESDDDEDGIISADLNSIGSDDDISSTNDPLGEEDEFPEFDLNELDDEEEPELELETDDSSEPDFDDPFMDLEDEQVDESVLRMEEFDDTEIIPVIKNITTDEPASDKKEETKEEEPAKPEKKKKEKKSKASSDQKAAPAWLWIVLVLVIIGGGVVGLGYFNILNIPFISSGSSPVASSQPSTTPPPPPPVVEETPTESTSNNEQAPAQQQQTTQQAEQPAEPIVENPQPVQNTTSTNAEKYGLIGTLSEAGMDGFTIIMYSLSNQQNAIAEQQKLQEDGYRAIVMPVESERYGTLWRVSLGQFASLFDAAVAAEEIESLLPDNYFIKKIN